MNHQPHTMNRQPHTMNRQPHTMNACSARMQCTHAVHARMHAHRWAPPAAPLECVGDDDVLVALNNQHAGDVAALAARRVASLSPSEARGTLLIATGEKGVHVQLTLRLWSGATHTVVTEARAASLDRVRGRHSAETSRDVGVDVVQARVDARKAALLDIVRAAASQ